MTMDMQDKTYSESDPTGRSPHESGAKLDHGKIRPALVLGAFARALWAVCEIGTFGARKYSDNGWVDVPNGLERYEDAGLRHWMKKCMGEENDSDSELTHLAHEAWNALARLERTLREKEIETQKTQTVEEAYRDVSEMFEKGVTAEDNIERPSGPKHNYT